MHNKVKEHFNKYSDSDRAKQIKKKLADIDKEIISINKSEDGLLKLLDSGKFDAEKLIKKQEGINNKREKVEAERIRLSDQLKTTSNLKGIQNNLLKDSKAMAKASFNDKQEIIKKNIARIELAYWPDFKAHHVTLVSDTIDFFGDGLIGVMVGNATFNKMQSFGNLDIDGMIERNKEYSSK